MSVGDREQTSTKRPKGYLCWQMVCWMKGLMNHPILKVATDVRLLRTHTRERDSIKVERNSGKREYAIVIREFCKERKSFTKRTDARRSNTTIKTPTPNASMRQGENLHQAAQGLPPLENGLVGEGRNEPPNSQGCNQCVIIMHTEGGEAGLKWNKIHANKNMPLLLGNEVRKDKASIKEPRRGAQTPQSRHRHQMLVGY
jgi:hypothetical protein